MNVTRRASRDATRAAALALAGVIALAATPAAATQPNPAPEADAALAAVAVAPVITAPATATPGSRVTIQWTEASGGDRMVMSALVVDGERVRTFPPSVRQTTLPLPAGVHQIYVSVWFADPLELDSAVHTITVVGAPADLYRDVTPAHPFYDQILWASEFGITTGYADGTFRPASSINRDAMAAFLFRLEDNSHYTPPSTPVFIDVPTSHPFYREISWMYDQGISTGWDGPGGPAYRPADPVSRDAMAAFLFRYAEPWNYEPSGQAFADVATDHPFYVSISWMADAGLSTGYPGADGPTYRPATPVARDAMAAFLDRLSQAS